MIDPTVPSLIAGGLAVDDRGTLRFANDFDFAGVRRFYVVSNYAAGFIRAWHAHRYEAKYVFVSSGAAIVGAVAIDNWEHPDAALQPQRYVLSAEKPSVLYIPGGYANGFKSLTADTQLFFFSTSSLDESRGDDVRYDARYWDIWQVEER